MESTGRVTDPRMRGFRTRASVAEVLAWIDASIGRLGEEAVGLAHAAGRVLAGPVRAGVSVPHFDRAAMDGYALRGEETHGSDPYNPAVFRVIGAARPGRPFDADVRPGEAVEIATGALLPRGADAVAMVETTRGVEGGSVAVFEPVAVGRHIGRVGEDVEEGAIVFEAGRVLRPQDLGVLSAIGCPSVRAVRRPRVRIVVTGDELLPAGSAPRGSCIPDMNSPMLAALAARDGASVEIIGPLRDDRELLRGAVDAAALESDLVLITGGSSTGPEDHAPSLVAELGQLVVHGVAIRPASPFGLGLIGGVPVALLPGNPVSCLCAYDFFAGRIARRLAGRAADWPYRLEPRPLSVKLDSVLGRTDYVRARLDEDGRVEPIAVSGASVLSSTTRADGFVVVTPDLEGLPAGATVDLWRYD